MKLGIAALVATALKLSSAEASTISFSDTSFASVDWVDSFLRSDPGISYASTQAASGGNPGAYRRFTGTYSGASFPALVKEIHLRNGAVFQPSVQGPIISLTYSFDIGAFDTTNNVFSATFLAYQNNSLYVHSSGYGLQGSSGWFPVSPQTAFASSFVLISGTGPTRPDFSSSGAPIQFGYLSELYFTQANTRTGGIDNWSVAVNYKIVPEPSTLLLQSFGMLALLVSRRKRRARNPSRSVDPWMA